MDLHKIRLSNPQDLEYVLRRPLDAVNFLGPKDIFGTMKNCAQKITVHLYPVSLPSRRKQKCLLDYNKWNYHQVYLAIQDERIFACVGHGDTSAARERHNNLIDLFLQDKNLRDDVPTAVLATFKGTVLASHLHRSYAYSNHDIGMNWDRSIIERLGSSRLPYSFHKYLSQVGDEVRFKARGRDVLVYRAARA